MNAHTANVLAALQRYVVAYEHDLDLDVLEVMDDLDEGEKDWFADFLDVYLLRTPHRRPVSEEAKRFVAAIAAQLGDRPDPEGADDAEL